MKKDKIYFASDFHLGSPTLSESHKREKIIIKWMDQIKNNAKSIYLLGDIFDFWFEYKKVVPKGFIRILGKIAELNDSGISIHIIIITIGMNTVIITMSVNNITIIISMTIIIVRIRNN